jgi:hypothetical protein
MNRAMTTLGITMLVLSALAVVATAAGLAASVRRRWRLATMISRSVALAGPALLLAGLAWVVRRAGSSGAAREKARVLAAGVAEIMNCGAILGLATVACAVLWIVAGWRVRVARRRAG